MQLWRILNLMHIFWSVYWLKMGGCSFICPSNPVTKIKHMSCGVVATWTRALTWYAQFFAFFFIVVYCKGLWLEDEFDRIAVGGTSMIFSTLADVGNFLLRCPISWESSSSLFLARWNELSCQENLSLSTLCAKITRQLSFGAEIGSLRRIFRQLVNGWKRTNWHSLQL